MSFLPHPIPLKERPMLSITSRIARRLRDDRGDVPGWVLITLMTAGLATRYAKG